MRKWQDLAAPDDPGSWYAVSGMWPTPRGTYELADVSTTAGSATASGNASDCNYAFAYGVSSAGVLNEYVAADIAGVGWVVHSWDGTTLTARYTGTDPVRGNVMMAKYGNVALLATGTSAVKIQAATSFAGNFGAVADAPTNVNIIGVQSNAVIALSTGSNTWYASDVGDYTTWTPAAGKESATGSIISHPGNSTAGVAYGNDFYVFKQGSIHRMTYVGGVLKWQVQTAWVGLGVPRSPNTSTFNPSQDWAIATTHGIAFYGGNGNVWLFDGASPPRLLNPLTTIPVEAIFGVFTFDPTTDTLCIAPSAGSSASGVAKTNGATTDYASLYHYYNFRSDAWGTGIGSATEYMTTGNGQVVSGVLRGNYYDRINASPKPAFWVSQNASGSTLVRSAPTDAVTGSIASTAYLQTMKVGAPDGKTNFNRLTPIVRRRVLGSTPSAALSMELFREREDTTAQNTIAITESTLRKRFDLLNNYATDNYARFKVTWTNTDVEVDDFKLAGKGAGTE